MKKISDLLASFISAHVNFSKKKNLLRKTIRH